MSDAHDHTIVWPSNVRPYTVATMIVCAAEIATAALGFFFILHPFAAFIICCIFSVAWCFCIILALTFAGRAGWWLLLTFPAAISQFLAFFIYIWSLHGYPH